MKNYPYAFQAARDLKTKGISQQLPDGRWIPARPMGYASFMNRVRCAWKVFTGEADIVEWPDFSAMLGEGE
jgi:hypothetical protein